MNIPTQTNTVDALLDDIATIKTDLKAAINEKGGELNDDDLFSVYPEEVRALTIQGVAYTELTGTEVIVNPNKSYYWSAVDVGSVITASGFTSGLDESCAILITMGVSATITGTNITLVDAPEEGVNHCFIRSMPNGDVKLYVSYLED